MLAGTQRKGNPRALWEGMQIAAATVENSMEFPPRVKNGSALWSSNSTSGNIPEETWNTNLKNICGHIHCNVIYNSQAVKATQMPIHKWLDKKVVVHIYSGILLSHKKNKILPFATAWMDLEDIMLSEISQRKTNNMISLICEI